MLLTDSFIEQCAHEYFNGFNHLGVPHQQRLTFEQFVNDRKLEIERGI